MENKQQIKFIYLLDTEIQDYNVRSKVIERHINDVYPTARTVMRYDMRIKRYATTTIVNTFVSGITEEIVKTLAAIINGVLQLDSVTYQIGLGTPRNVTKRLKENREAWYMDAGDEEDEEQIA